MTYRASAKPQPAAVPRERLSGGVVLASLTAAVWCVTLAINLASGQPWWLIALDALCVAMFAFSAGMQRRADVRRAARREALDDMLDGMATRLHPDAEEGRAQ